MSVTSRAVDFASPLAAGVPAHATTSEFGSTQFADPARISQSKVACCLDRELLARFLTWVPGARVSSPDALFDLAFADLVHLIVADPALNNGRCFETLVKLRGACPSVSIVVYTMLRASVMSSIVRLAQHGVQEVVIYGTDDSKARFDDAIERSATTPLTSAVLRLLDSKLVRLPSALAVAVKEMFESPRTVGNVHQLAAAGGMTRRSLYRHCAVAGLRSPRLLIASARIVRAAHVLAHSEISVRDVALSLGFSKPDILTLQVMSLTGLRPRQLRDSSVLATLPELIAHRLGGGDSATRPTTPRRQPGGRTPDDPFPVRGQL